MKEGGGSSLGWPLKHQEAVHSTLEVGHGVRGMEEEPRPNDSRLELWDGRPRARNYLFILSGFLQQQEQD